MYENNRIMTSSDTPVILSSGLAGRYPPGYMTVASIIMLFVEQSLERFQSNSTKNVSRNQTDVPYRFDTRIANPVISPSDNSQYQTLLISSS